MQYITKSNIKFDLLIDQKIMILIFSLKKLTIYGI